MPNHPTGLLRHEVEELLSTGIRWRVHLLLGGTRPDDVGAGPADFPAGVLNHVPNVVDARRLAGGRRITKTFFRAGLVEDDHGVLLVLAEP